MSIINPLPETSTWKQGELTVTVKWEQDVYYEPDHYGSWRNTKPETYPYADLAEKIMYDSKGEKFSFELMWSNWTCGHFPYWIPDDPEMHKNDDCEGSYLIEDVQRLWSLFGEEWSVYTCVIEISYNEIRLGWNTLSNIESDGGESYHREMIQDCLIEAQSEAVDKLNALLLMQGLIVDTLKCDLLLPAPGESASEACEKIPLPSSEKSK